MEVGCADGYYGDAPKVSPEKNREVLENKSEVVKKGKFSCCFCLFVNRSEMIDFTKRPMKSMS